MIKIRKTVGIETMGNIAVIMSTYNGEKYIEEQLNSILEQINIKHDTVKIYVRDDGSKDHTVDILREYEKKNLLQIIDSDGNIGVKRSFFKLLGVVEADYYFFSDQDDIWFADKLIEFIKQFKLVDKKIPQGIFSDLMIVDKYAVSTNIKMSQTLPGDNRNHSLNDLLFNFKVTGAALAINRPLRDETLLLTKEDIKNVRMHDSIIAKISAATGSLTYIEKPTIYYRQHENNVIGASKNSIKKYEILKKFKAKCNELRRMEKENKVLYEKFYDVIKNDSEKTMLKNVYDFYFQRNIFKKIFLFKKIESTIDSIAKKVTIWFV